MEESDNPLYQNKDWLKEKYIDHEMSTGEIAEFCGVSQSTIRKWILKFNIKLRTLLESKQVKVWSRTTDAPVKNKSWLYNKYVVEKKTFQEIADECNIALRTVARYIHKYNIKPRANKGISKNCGSNNSNWKGGISGICPICDKQKSYKAKKCQQCHFNELKNNPDLNGNYKGFLDITQCLRSYLYDNWRPKIFSRDNYTCQECGDNTGGNLNAHHIVPFRVIRDQIIIENIDLDLKKEECRAKLINIAKNDNRINDLDNGITLCNLCHDGEHRKLKFDFDQNFYIYQAKIIDIIDGDTMYVEISLGFDLYTKQTIRLFGIDTSELKSNIVKNKEKAEQAKYLVEYLCDKNQKITVKTFEKDKYGRWLSIIILDFDVLNNILLENNLAMPYYG